MAQILDLEELSFERGAHLLVQRGLQSLMPGGELAVTGVDPALRDRARRVQVMTYLIENEMAALVAPARLLARALLKGGEMGTSGAGGRQSLATLITEPDFALASFLLSVLGEGSFLNLLTFLDRNAPDPLTRQVARLARQDEARHVAFGVAHLQHQATVGTTLRTRLRAAVERRHDVLIDTAGLNQDVFDSLVTLAAGEWTAEAIGRGYDQVQRLQAEMDEGRQHRLIRLGFPADEVAEISALHTRNFM